MKVIDLLNKIANGEEVPKKIRITDVDDRCTKHYNFFYDEDDQEYKDDELFPLGARLILDRVLNEKVEIIESQEHKIPEKIEYHQVRRNEVEVDYIEDGIVKHFCLNKKQRYFADKINEIIDYLEEIK